MDEELPVISESAFNRISLGVIPHVQDDLPTINESDFAKIGQPPESFLGSLITGVKNAPSAAVNLVASIPTGVSNLFQSITAPSESLENGTLENTLRGTGTLAAGTAGAGVGATVGAFGGPFAPITVPIGAAIGGAAGLLGFNKLNQATESDAPTTAAQDISELGQNIGTGSVFGAAGSLFKTAKSNLTPNISPSARAGALIRNAIKEDPTVIENLPTNSALSATETLAEATQSPKLAQLQDLLGKRSPEANEALVANEVARRSTQQELLNTLTDEAPKTVEAGGADLRALLQDNATESFKKASAPYKEISDNAQVPITSLRENLNGIIASEYPAGGVPDGLQSILKEINKSETLGGLEIVPEAQSYKYVQSLRGRLDKELVDAQKNQYRFDARVIKDLKNQFDDTINAAPDPTNPRNLSAEEVGKYFQANKDYAAAADTFREGQVGTALRTLRQGDYVVDSSNVVTKLFNGKAEATKQLIKALPDTPEAFSTARGAIKDLIARQTETNDGILAPEKFRSWISKNREGLTAKVDGKQLFSDDHIAALDQISKDLGFLSGHSKTSVSSLANRASKGQPTTAQALVGEAATRLVGSDIPFVRSGVQAYQRAVDSVLTEALINKKSFATELVKKATPERLATFRNRLGLSASAASTDDKKATLTVKSNGFLTPAKETPVMTDALDPKAKVLNIAMDMLPRSTSTKGIKYNSDPKIASVEKQIDKDPYLSTLYEIESGRNPLAKNSTSSAKGAFQFIDKTAKSVGLSNPLDIGESLTAITKLTDENKARFDTTDPVKLYAAHYLGATVLDKFLKGKALTATEKAQLDYLKTKVLPRFRAVYASRVGGVTEV